MVDPITAGAAVNGVVELETSNGSLRVQPAAVVSRFPGLGSRFVVVDIGAAGPAMDLLQPGAGTANEMWLAAGSRADERALSERLSDTTFSSVDVDRRVARQTALATDPLAVVTLLILTASALVSLLLGRVRGDVRRGRRCRRRSSPATGARARTRAEVGDSSRWSPESRLPQY